MPVKIMIPIYVISLPDAEARRASISKRLNALGLSFTFFDAFDGRNGRRDAFEAHPIKESWTTTGSAIACAASHRSLHQMIVNSGVSQALIIEDDAEFSDDFPTLLEASKSLDCDIVKFEGGPEQRRKVSVGTVGHRSVVVFHIVTLGCAAYLINRTAAERLLALPHLDQAMDVAFSDPRLRLKVYEIEPRAAWQDRNFETQIEQNGGAPSRLSLIPRTRYSLSKYITIGRAHGAKTALRLYAQKLWA